MADYVGFVGERPISVEEYIDEEHRGKIKCICGSNIHYVNESCFFMRAGIEIQRVKHFSHPKGNKCFIPKEKQEKRNKKKTDEKPELTLEEKRKKRLSKLIIKHLKDYQELNYNKGRLRELILKSKINKIDYKEEIKKNDLSKFYKGSYIYNINNNEYISFKNLRNIEIESNKFYRFNEIDYTYILKKNNCIYDYLYISSSIIKEIVNDYGLYCEYLKKLSLIIIYYSSRCDKEDINSVHNKLVCLEKSINDKINEVKFIEDD